MLMNNVKGSPIINGNSITENYQVVEFRDVKPNGSLLQLVILLVMVVSLHMNIIMVLT
ncbi:MAG: hypothetical protein CM15mV13_2970 [uncultured marine virus]|nr:MAG: hypothetical protein CM15mV13_2970 [uncultured marine virus]